MNILYLSNGAPNYFKFFNKLAQHLLEDAHQVEVAVDSSYARDINEVDSLGIPVYEFSYYLGNYVEDPEVILLRYQDMPLNQALLSDFERGEIYRFGKNRDTSYYRKLQGGLLAFFESIITSSKIEMVIYENVSNAFAYHAWFVCKRLGISYCGFEASRLPGRFLITSDPLNTSLIFAPIVEDIRTGRICPTTDIRLWCDNYLKKIDNTVPEYMNFNPIDNLNSIDNLKLFSRYINREKLTKLLNAWRHRRDEHRLAFQVGNPLSLSWQMLWRNLKRKFKLSFCQIVYSAPQPAEQFLLYGLHYHPEASTSILAGAYLDEFEVVRNIAFSLPAGVMLYVKDHPSAFGYPTINFYKKIVSLPNVRLIHPFEDTKKLISQSKAVITLSGTIGYEALMLNKRVFLYGSVFYEFHPNVVKVNNPAKLFDLFKLYLDCPLAVGNNYNRDFLAAYYIGSFPGTLNFNESEDNFAELIKEILRQMKNAF